MDDDSNVVDIRGKTSTSTALGVGATSTSSAQTEIQPDSTNFNAHGRRASDKHRHLGNHKPSEPTGMDFYTKIAFGLIYAWLVGITWFGITQVIDIREKINSNHIDLVNKINDSQTTLSKQMMDSNTLLSSQINDLQKLIFNQKLEEKSKASE
jgi:hypothetical protein